MDWLNEDWAAGFGAYRPQGQTPFANYWRNQQSNVWDDYMSKLGQQAMKGQAPSLNYSDFLGNFPFMQRWRALAPSQRGEYPSRFAPSLRWNI